ncbi:uncharacterized protein LOC129957523 isoform X2 [Argiope bruennichi]|uniref:uncharacterized protein LOC129957523 isoform X2 n=1 Tax=Argiope bruennichi TaxID=94029 RepID=UPI0024958DE4|nr:uncharacterized protein LOC129957523 isoform X2 [Argiope bruennichi]
MLGDTPNEITNEPTLHPGSPTRTTSSPAILGIPNDESSSQDNSSSEIPFKKQRPHSCPQTLSEETPLNSSNEPGEHVENDRNNEQQTDGSRSTRCSAFIDFYRDSVIEYRNSRFIHFFQFLFSLIPISGIIMAIIYAEECPASPTLPALGAILGALGVIFMGFWTAGTVYEQRGRTFFDQPKSILSICITLLFLVALDVYLLGHMSPSFDEFEKHYCNQTFYRYAILKNILTALAIVLGAIFYLPGNLSFIYSCFCNCCEPQPATANVFYYAF